MANEIATTQVLAGQASSVTASPVVRQLLLLVGLAASVAIGVYVVLWAQEPGYRSLYGRLDDRDAATVVQALQAENIPYRLDNGGGISVPGSRVDEVRIKLASSGVPRGGNSGFELMEKDNGFGVSQFMESARYQHAMEGELARSISTMRNIQQARVHLAVPRQSSFIRNRQKPSASVVLQLYTGQRLDKEQVAAIVHLVGASVPGMNQEQVTVVDQHGRLLTRQDDSSSLSMTARQFDYQRGIEQSYVKRIEDLLVPITGPNGVRAEVSAEMDFTVSEQTEENYVPNPAAIRSEEVIEENKAASGAKTPEGVPGSLSNQPPGAGTAPEKVAAATETATNANATAQAGQEETASNGTRRAMRNYELGKTISHTKRASGQIKRLTVAVVVDHQRGTDDDGNTTSTALTEEQLQRMTSLVREAVGFDDTRGDRVQVINVPFQQPGPIEDLPAPPIWEQPIVMDLGKQLLAGIAIIVLIMGVLRPLLKGLLARPVQQTVMVSPQARQHGVESGPSGYGQGPVGLLPSPGMHEAKVDTARQIVREDPKRVAQVVKNWVGSDA
jgi:flagellar M-ring protein FliF